MVFVYIDRSRRSLEQFIAVLSHTTVLWLAFTHYRNVVYITRYILLHKYIDHKKNISCTHHEHCVIG